MIEHYVKRGFSCALITSDSQLEVQYDNGVRLKNYLVQTRNDYVDLQLQWSSLPDEAYSLSIQVFDAAGEKVLGQDSVIGHVTLDRQQLDLSTLPPGDYTVKLIMYNFESGAIVSGMVSADGARFDRYLEVATIHPP
ncbi:MAG: hypothetical protein OXI77_12720 [Chloroflexota bacterium]|nr:hypothetical protein [Chloroflexota bacterium]MDE2910760.1 hypothetical protein [Chloroflexota bacterium]